MADQSDVEATLASLVEAALYPLGTAAGSACGQSCRIYRGWPNPQALDQDLVAGLTNVTISAVDGTARNTTRYPDTWLADPPVATLLVTVAGTTITFGGSADAGQLAGIGADGKTYVYRTQAADTPELVAGALASQVRSDYVAHVMGSTVTLFGASEVMARVVADAAGRLEIRRQSQRFRIVTWCNDPLVRDAAVGAMDVALANTRFAGLPDGSQARLLFAGGMTQDRSEDASLYRRDLLYDVEFATTILATQPAMLFGSGTANSTPFVG